MQYLVNHSAVKFGNEELIVYWIIDARVTWFDQCYWHSLWIAQLIYCRVIDLKSVECGFTQRDATFFTIWSFWSSCKIKMIAFDFILNEKYWSWNWIEDYSYWFEDYNTSKQWKTNFANYAPQTWSSSCFSSGIVSLLFSLNKVYFFYLNSSLAMKFFFFFAESFMENVVQISRYYFQDWTKTWKRYLSICRQWPFIF